ncbi:hypothetical protein N7540_013118 [Penicillium herquei]|nr:hypothetical protein N7540_013118 [Penicillium herquei]
MSQAGSLSSAQTDHWVRCCMSSFECDFIGAVPPRRWWSSDVPYRAAIAGRGDDFIFLLFV